MSRPDPARPAIDDCWNRIGVWRRGETACPQLEHVIHCRNCEVYARAGRELLQHAIDPQDREEWTLNYARPRPHKERGRDSALIFRLGDDWLALPGPVIREITRSSTVRRLPHNRNPLLKGLVNLRGELQLCLSLGRLLGLNKGQEPAAYGSMAIAERMLFIGREEQRYVFPVTEVSGIHHYADTELHELPATLDATRSRFSRGILHWREAQVALLDADRLFDHLGRELG
ncbi:chemotaxis protein CheW [Thiohalobacter sp. IOR34]|uniref:chemotaxis protein CheW n=1 Tax=Thiohalobacter sp. IOR34 TaxID=3057176 RepID=UPI0025AEFF62|nr:chemotaxis protein CheW [Thiohalobacter sp. IOR34]WJW74747.1 chemotaxis protein CheW [Thiohalobacter sp. IOR34]